MEVVDTDAWIEAEAGATIKEIFAAKGEKAFRDWETKAIEKVVSGKSKVVSLGGGAVLRAENRALLRGRGITVWLRASAKTLSERISADPLTASRRPSLSKLAGYDEIVKLLEEREPIYCELADFTVDTEGRTPENIAEEIASLYRLKSSEGNDQA